MSPALLILHSFFNSMYERKSPKFESMATPKNSINEIILNLEKTQVSLILATEILFLSFVSVLRYIFIRLA